MESLVKLTVKTPNQGFDDIQVNCQLDWTVRKLKEYLQDVYPSKPSSSSQKLIYLGRLLQDHLSLKEVFGFVPLQEWGARTLHIVCNEQSNNMTTATSTSARQAGTAMSSPPTTFTSSSTNSSTDGLRYRGSTTAPTATVHNTNSTPTTSPMLNPFFAPMPYPQQQQQQQQQQQPGGGTQFYQVQAQLMQQYQQQMQQYYQHMMQWQQHQQQHNVYNNPWMSLNQYVPNTFPTPPNTPASTVPSPFLQPQPQPQPQPQSQPQPQPQAQPEPQQLQQQQQPEVANAQVGGGAGAVGAVGAVGGGMVAGGGGMAGMAEEEEDVDDGGNPRQQDWLDWLYTSLRAVMLFSIVYFYSSTSRFLMVTILAFLLYLYQNGWFTPRRAAVPQPPQPEQPQPEQPQPDQPQQPPQQQQQEQPQGEAPGDDQQQQEQQNNGQQSDHGNDNSRTETQAPQPPRPNPLRTLCTFCVSFVTSLVPTPPAVGQQ